MRKILFEMEYNKAEGAKLVFCGPSNKDETYAICVDCPECGEEIQVVFSLDNLEQLHKKIGLGVGEDKEGFVEQDAKKPQEKGVNSELLAASKKFLDTWKRAGPLGSHQFEKFDVAVRMAEMAVEKAEAKED